MHDGEYEKREIRFVHDCEPRTWKRTKTVYERRTGIRKRVNADDYRWAKDAISWCVFCVVKKTDYGQPVFPSGPVHVNITVRIKRPKNGRAHPDAQCYGDIDNYVKIVLDAMINIVYKDDSQVTQLVVSKEFTDGLPCIAVEADNHRKLPHASEID